ncbi:MAG: hypothetical protein ACXVFN_01295 [Solirubrobacteraceae bacterium]
MKRCLPLCAAALAWCAIAGAGAAHAAPCETCPPPGGGGGGTTYHDVTVTVSGLGTVTDGTKTCAANTTCTWTYAAGSTQSLTASASAAGYSFTGRLRRRHPARTAGDHLAGRPAGAAGYAADHVRQRR